MFVPEIGMEACLQGLLKRGFVPDSLLDIGASVGGWTIAALKFWPHAEYFLIEPLEERRPALEALRAAVPSVDFLIAGAGDREGQMALGIDRGHLEGSSFAYTRLESRMVAMVTVDGLRRGNRFRQPQFMKLDVQGFEQKVLQGAARTMEACELILLELPFFRYHPSMVLLHEFLPWMAERNFVPYEIVDVMRRPLDGAMGQCDILFVREDHWLRRDPRWV